MERIDNINYNAPTGSSTVESLETNLFLTGPAEFLCKEVANLIYETTPWAQIFGDNIDGYKRMDYPQRALPVMRIYNDTFTKSFDSWFVEGDF